MIPNVFSVKSEIPDGTIYDSRRSLTTRGIWQQRGAGSRQRVKIGPIPGLDRSLNLHIGLKRAQPGALLLPVVL